MVAALRELGGRLWSWLRCARRWRTLQTSAASTVKPHQGALLPACQRFLQYGCRSVRRWRCCGACSPSGWRAWWRQRSARLRRARAGPRTSPVREPSAGIANAGDRSPGPMSCRPGPCATAEARRCAVGPLRLRVVGVQRLLVVSSMWHARLCGFRCRASAAPYGMARGAVLVRVVKDRHCDAKRAALHQQVRLARRQRRIHAMDRRRTSRLPSGMPRSGGRRLASLSPMPGDVAGTLFEPAPAPAGMGHDGRREDGLQLLPILAHDVCLRGSLTPRGTRRQVASARPPSEGGRAALRRALLWPVSRPFVGMSARSKVVDALVHD